MSSSNNLNNEEFGHLYNILNISTEQIKDIRDTIIQGEYKASNMVCLQLYIQLNKITQGKVKSLIKGNLIADNIKTLLQNKPTPLIEYMYNIGKMKKHIQDISSHTPKEYLLSIKDTKELLEQGLSNSDIKLTKSLKQQVSGLINTYDRILNQTRKKVVVTYLVSKRSIYEDNDKIWFINRITLCSDIDGFEDNKKKINSSFNIPTLENPTTEAKNPYIQYRNMHISMKLRNKIKNQGHNKQGIYIIDSDKTLSIHAIDYINLAESTPDAESTRNITFKTSEQLKNELY